MTKQLGRVFLSFVLSAVVGCSSSGSSPDGGAGTGGRGGGTAGVGPGGAGSGGSGTPTGGTSGATGGAAGTSSGSGGSAGGGGSGGAGGVAGSGGTGVAGLGGAGHGGGGGATACQQVDALDRSCSTNADCLAVAHTINCCGTGAWIGLRSTEAQRFATLESACDASYPQCGCPLLPPTTDDGSTVLDAASVSVSCQGGACKTFAKACGQPCEAGRSCLTCGAPDAGVSVCSLRCTFDKDCKETAYPTCQFGADRGICTASSPACSGV